VLYNGTATVNVTVPARANGLTHFIVVAVNSQGDSQRGVSNDGTPEAQRPSPPINAQAVAFDFNTNPGIVADVTWDAPVDDGGADIVNYVIDVLDSTLRLGTCLPHTVAATPTVFGVGRQCITAGVDNVIFIIQAVNRQNLKSNFAQTQSGISAGFGAPSAPLNPAAIYNGDSTVKVLYDAPLTDGGQHITNYTASIAGQRGGRQEHAFCDAQADDCDLIVFDGLDDGTYQFIVFAYNDIAMGAVSLQTNTVTVSHASKNLLALWIILGIVGLIGILVGLWYLRRCLIAQKNRNNNKLERAQDTNELVIVKDTGADLDDNTTKTREGTTSDDTLPASSSQPQQSPPQPVVNTGSSSLDDDESHWVSHGN